MWCKRGVSARVNDEQAARHKAVAAVSHHAFNMCYNTQEACKALLQALQKTNMFLHSEQKCTIARLFVKVIDITATKM